MQKVQLSDNLYKKAQRAARNKGASVDSFIAEAVRNYLDDDPDNFDHLFTPEVIAHLDGISARIKEGEGKTIEEVERDFAKHRAAWLKARKR